MRSEEEIAGAIEQPEELAENHREVLEAVLSLPQKVPAEVQAP